MEMSQGIRFIWIVENVVGFCLFRPVRMPSIKCDFRGFLIGSCGHRAAFIPGIFSGDRDVGP